MTTEDLLEIPAFLDRRRTNTTAKEETMQNQATAETTETAKVTKLPPAKAKGVKTQADVKNPKKDRRTRLGRLSDEAADRAKKKPGTAKGRKTTKTTKKGRQTVEAKGKAAKKPKAEGNGFGRAKDDFANSDKITVVAKKNPHEKGTDAAARFSLFKTGQTVGANLEAQKEKGYRRRRGAIRKAREAGYIKIA